MSETMIERVARTIASEFSGWAIAEPSPEVLRVARAAIEAMREPTEEMLAAMSPSGRYADIVVPEQWANAIDAALKE